MAAGTTPIFVATPKNSFLATGVNSNVAFDGSGSNQVLLYTAGANASKIEDIYITHMGSNAVNVVRFFINNGGPVGTATNNALVHEETMAVNTASQTAASIPVIWRANLVLQATYRLYATIGSTVASGYMITCVGGDY
ncbi:MAG: hypothetical protein NVS1B10_03290 [Candidatus Saccharimonadales bacterium]